MLVSIIDDKLIQDTQLNANYSREITEWMSHDKFKNVKQIDVNSLKIHAKYGSIQFHGITQDPETHSFMMVLKYEEDGNLLPALAYYDLGIEKDTKKAFHI
ncbi:hypothetical protein Glove_230g36 [Diversispora epigaea]|uniref:Uncharacterized protein n=1 Tax=Diversispora epigaea TaxID=1348612 RepID=A0A397ICQ1_9GLOM|nr:hypothetical protein Glove_230g36 [Diversispora epigaea]